MNWEEVQFAGTIFSGGLGGIVGIIVSEYLMELGSEPKSDIPIETRVGIDIAGYVASGMLFSYTFHLGIEFFLRNFIIPHGIYHIADPL